MKYIFLSILLLFVFFANSQILILNEVSNGAGGNEEYVELLVVGTPSCGLTSTMSLVGYYIDDNNGVHATSSTGTGVASGCIRLKNAALWQNVPFGTLILIYDDLNKDPAITLPNDLSTTDGNNRLIVPISSTVLFERNTIAPSPGGPSTYPTTAFTAGGIWTPLGMRNGGDSFQTVSPTGTIIFSVSFDDNNLTSTSTIYFAADQGGMVIYNANTVNNTYTTQANWLNTVVAGNQTPGLPNNTANATWINSMTVAPTSFTLGVTKLNAQCVCNGSVTITPIGGASPYSYTWSPNVSVTNSATSLCAGNYTINIASVNGCSQSTVINIASNNSNTVSVNSETICAGVNTILTATPSTTGGTFLWSPNGETTQTITVNPTVQTYYVVTYSLNGCSSNATSTINIKSIPTLTLSASSNTICPNNTATLTASGGTLPYTWSNNASNTASVNITNGGATTVFYTNNCGNIDTKSITVNVTLFNASILANPTTGIKPLVVAFTNNSSALATTYTWVANNTIVNTQTLALQTYTLEGTYTAYLTVTDGFCFDTDSVQIIVLKEEQPIIIPNVFTPNGDGINDLFKISGINSNSNFNCTIFDRWGLKLYDWSDVTKGWDGKTNGKLCNDGTYFYVLNFTDNTNNEIKKQGNLNLFK